MSKRPLPPHVQAAIKRGKKDRKERELWIGRPSTIPDVPAKRKPRIQVAPKAERTVDGILFASKKEANRYRELALFRRLGDVRFFLRQVPFHLPGGVKYLLDFMVFWADGSITYEDVKGMRTEMYRLKKRQVEALYPITITEL